MCLFLISFCDSSAYLKTSQQQKQTSNREDDVYIKVHSVREVWTNTSHTHFSLKVTAKQYNVSWLCANHVSVAFLYPWTYWTVDLLGPQKKPAPLE